MMKSCTDTTSGKPKTKWEVRGAGGSGGQIEEIPLSGMNRDQRRAGLAWEYSMDLVQDFLDQKPPARRSEGEVAGAEKSNGDELAALKAENARLKAEKEQLVKKLAQEALEKENAKLSKETADLEKKVAAKPSLRKTLKTLKAI